MSGILNLKNLSKVLFLMSQLSNLAIVGGLRQMPPTTGWPERIKMTGGKTGISIVIAGISIVIAGISMVIAGISMVIGCLY